MDKRELSVSEEMMMFICSKRKKQLSKNSDFLQTASVISSIFFELLQEEFIGMNEKKRIIVVDSNNYPENKYQKRVYDEIIKSKKTRKLSDWIEKIVHRKELYEIITENLVDLGYINFEKSVGIFSTKKLTVNDEVLDHLVQKIRAEFLEDGILTDETAFVTSLLNRNNMLKLYFSKYESDQLKARIKEIKNEPIGKIVKEVIDTYNAVLIMLTSTVIN